MAQSYSVYVTESGGTWTLSSVIREPATVPAGGTSLLTNTYTQNSATGVVSAASGFLDTATYQSDGLGHAMRNPGEAIERGMQIIRNDRAFNG